MTESWRMEVGPRMPELVPECCGHCGLESDIPSDELSHCEHCGESIRPCCMCDMDKDECDWQENGDCRVFPHVSHPDHDKYGQIPAAKLAGTVITVNSHGVTRS